MKLRNKLKNKKGMSTLDFIINVFILLILFSFLTDLFVISFRQYKVSQFTNDIVRVISKQGGVRTTAPTNFPGGNDNYLDKTEFQNIINSRLQDIGAINYSVNLFRESGGTEVSSTYPSPTATNFSVDYQEYIRIEIKYNYKWSLMSAFIPGGLKGTLTSSKIGYSEYKYDYSNWQGEN